MERYVDEGAKSYSPFAALSDVSPEYQPGRGDQQFHLITVRLPQSCISVFRADSSESLLRHYLRAGSWSTHMTKIPTLLAGLAAVTLTAASAFAQGRSEEAREKHIALSQVPKAAVDAAEKALGAKITEA
jgi:hypothetical protein